MDDRVISISFVTFLVNLTNRYETIIKWYARTVCDVLATLRILSHLSCRLLRSRQQQEILRIDPLT